ncbi:hypothetical protein [Aeromonas salmonicida]|uniref:hypothetical protein n=1 Tax=Aeromonas salmonicida TaxID=645 RepID=UPI003F7C850E
MVDAVMSKGGRALLAHQWHQAKSNFTPAIALLLSERQNGERVVWQVCCVFGFITDKT